MNRRSIVLPIATMKSPADVWTEEKLEEASRLWDKGVPAATIAAQLGVTLGSFLGTTSFKRERFPIRFKPAEKPQPAPRRVPKPVLTLVPKEPPRRTFFEGCYIEHVKRTTSTGAVVTMPRVSFIDG